MSEYARSDGTEDLDRMYVHLAVAMQPGVRFFRIDGRMEPFFGRGGIRGRDPTPEEVADYCRATREGR